MKKFWSFQARSDGVGELYLYGEIADASWLGDEITPAQFARELDALGELRELYVNIHSPGGDAFAGIAIYSILQRCPAKKIVRIDGLAASAASLIAMAGDVIQMPKGATMMIHNAWAHASGEAADLRKVADELDRLGGLMAEIYAWRTGVEMDAVRAMMDAETWMSGEEACAAGFADELVDGVQAAACAGWDEALARYAHAPERLHKCGHVHAGDSPARDAVLGISEPAEQAIRAQREWLWKMRKKVNGGHE